MTAPRLYHSVACSCPTAGCTCPAAVDDPGSPTSQRPDLLPAVPLQRAAPDGLLGAETVKYGSTAFVGTPDAASIRRVSLIRTGSVTHAFDQNARATPLELLPGRRRPRRQLPANRNDVPPGYYMLFIVDDKGVPSVAPLVRFPAPYEDTAAPSAPTNLERDRARRARRRSLDRGDRQHWRHALQRPPLEDAGLHADRGEQASARAPTPRSPTAGSPTGHLLLQGDGRGRRRQRRAAVGRGDRGTRSPTPPRPRSPRPDRHRDRAVRVADLDRRLRQRRRLGLPGDPLRHPGRARRRRPPTATPA